MAKMIFKIGKIILVITTLFLLTTGSISACTGFTCSQGNTILVGSNEDYNQPDFTIEVYPPEKNKHGRIYITIPYPLPWNPGFRVQIAGMNDQGLWHDAFLTPELPISFNPTKPPLLWNPLPYIMEKFSTVAEVKSYYQRFNLYFAGLAGLNENQLFYADQTGDSAIIEGEDIIPKAGDYQVCTNFLQSRGDDGYDPEFRRYNTAVSMLENMYELSVEYFKDICIATHSDRGWETVVSYVYDLTERMIYFYHYHDYDNVFILDMEKELAKDKPQKFYIPCLFEPSSNQDPHKPNRPSGPTQGNTREEYEYRTSGLVDPDGDDVFYLFDWGDGSYSGWFKSDSGAAWEKHIWKKQGNCNIKVKAKDIYGKESEWSEPLQVTMPKNNAININLLFYQLFDLFRDRITRIIPS